MYDSGGVVIHGLFSMAPYEFVTLLNLRGILARKSFVFSVEICEKTKKSQPLR
jgi:hypothetical protein